MSWVKFVRATPGGADADRCAASLAGNFVFYAGIVVHLVAPFTSMRLRGQFATACLSMTSLRVPYAISNKGPIH